MNDQPKTTVIRAAHYGETERRLESDVHAISLATELAAGIRAGRLARADLTHPGSSTVRFEWTQRINGEYRRRGGTDGGHIGAVPTAVVTVLDRLLENQ